MCKEIFWQIFRRSGRQLVLSGIVHCVQFSLSLVVIRWNSKHSLLIGVCLCVRLSLHTHSRQLGTDHTFLVGMSLHTECQSNVSIDITIGFRKVHTCSPNNSFKQKSHHLLIKEWIKKQGDAWCSRYQDSRLEKCVLYGDVGLNGPLYTPQADCYSEHAWPTFVLTYHHAKTATLHHDVPAI